MQLPAVIFQLLTGVSFTIQLQPVVIVIGYVNSYPITATYGHNHKKLNICNMLSIPIETICSKQIEVKPPLIVVAYWYVYTLYV